MVQVVEVVCVVSRRRFIVVLSYVVSVLVAVVAFVSVVVALVAVVVVSSRSVLSACNAGGQESAYCNGSECDFGEFGHFIFLMFER